MNNVILTADVEVLANRLPSLCKVLDNKRFFLTGGTGFFGKWLLHSFLGLRNACGLDVELTVLSRDPKHFLDSNPDFCGQNGLKFVAGDVRTFELTTRQPFDFVIHGATAASAQLEQEQPEEMYSVITEGTRHILDFTRQCSAKRILFISSGAVYGPQPPTLDQLPETYEGTPATAYGRGKKVSEQLCLEASSSELFDCVIARPFAFVGPYLPLDTHFAIGNFIQDCLESRPIVIRGDGTPLRSYLYAADLAEWLWTILLRGQRSQAYNVGSNCAISIRDLAHLVRECADTSNEIVVLGKEAEGALPARYVPSVDRAQKELALCQRISLPEAIRRTLLWHRDMQVKGSCR